MLCCSYWRAGYNLPRFILTRVRYLESESRLSTMLQVTLFVGDKDKVKGTNFLNSQILFNPKLLYIDTSYSSCIL